MSTQVPQETNGNAMAPTLYMALELSKKLWKLAFSDGKKKRLVTIKAKNLFELQEAIAKAKAKFGLAAEARVVSCYEAGRDGFWLHRFMVSIGIENQVVDSSSIEVNRRARRAKTDRIDAGKLLGMLRRYWGGERDVYSVVRVPSESQEDARRLHRELECLKKERGRHITRIRSLLTLHGIEVRYVGGSDWAEQVSGFRQWDGSPLLGELKGELLREGERLALVRQQIHALEAEQRRREHESDDPMIRKIVQLQQLGAIGPVSAWVFIMELFGWRKFNNRRELASLVGLTPMPYNSGDSTVEQGISKAGSRRVRALLIEISWLWLRYQPDSALSQWFNRRFAAGGKRMRRIGIVALARKLLIALWRYLETGEIPAGAHLKAV
ncbi:MAG: IS110 family transposase [Rhodobacteraceae bacterium]|nr:IS110 family transposase [Paracoccaceae bacterium]